MYIWNTTKKYNPKPPPGIEPGIRESESHVMTTTKDPQKLNKIRKTCMLLPGFEPGISPLLVARFNHLSHKS